MLRILQERARAGVEVKVIGQVAGRASFEVQKLAGMRLHTRTIIRDRRQAFVGSQSLRPAELDSRREVGLLVRDPKAVKQLVDTFESDWARPARRARRFRAAAADAPPRRSRAAASLEHVAKAVEVFTHELESLAATVKEAVREAVDKAGDDVLHDKDVKDTMKQVVKQAVKEAVKDAVHDGSGGPAARGAPNEHETSDPMPGPVGAGGPLSCASLGTPVLAGQGAAPTKEQAGDKAGFKEFSDPRAGVPQAAEDGRVETSRPEVHGPAGDDHGASAGAGEEDPGGEAAREGGRHLHSGAPAKRFAAPPGRARGRAIGRLARLHAAGRGQPAHAAGR